VALGGEKGWLTVGILLLQASICVRRRKHRYTMWENGREGGSRTTNCSQQELWKEHGESSGQHG
jgi:hypothetical protein